MGRFASLTCCSFVTMMNASPIRSLARWPLRSLEDYVDTVLKRTRSNRPLQQEPKTKVPLPQSSRGIVEMVDAPMAQTYRRRPITHTHSIQRQIEQNPPSSSVSPAQSATFHRPVLVAIGSSRSHMQESSSDGHLTSSVSTKSRQVRPEEHLDGENTCVVDISTQSSSSSYVLSASSIANAGQRTRGRDTFSIGKSLRESQPEDGRPCECGVERTSPGTAAFALFGVPFPDILGRYEVVVSKACSESPVLTVATP